MARKKSAPPPELDEDDDREAERLAEATEIAVETMTGDLRGFILDTLRHEQSKRPWDQRSEADQKDTVHRVDASVRAVVRKAVEQMAGHGRSVIKAVIEKAEVKDGIKAVLTLGRDDKHRHQLLDAVGYAVMIVVADPDEFTGERAPVELNPDQSSLLGDTIVVHSEPDNAPAGPLN